MTKAKHNIFMLLHGWFLYFPSQLYSLSKASDYSNVSYSWRGSSVALQNLLIQLWALSRSAISSPSLHIKCELTGSCSSSPCLSQSGWAQDTSLDHYTGPSGYDLSRLFSLSFPLPFNALERVPIYLCQHLQNSGFHLSVQQCNQFYYPR